MKIRIFYSLKIPDEIKNTIVSAANEAALPLSNVKWVSKEKLHVTLKFIKEFDESNLSDIYNKLAVIEDEFYAFNCQTNKFNFFYREGKPAILWLGLNVEPSLEHLVQKLNTIFNKYTLEDDMKKFKPHITLLRLKQNPKDEFIKAFEKYKLPNLTFIANETALMKSELHASGSTYTELIKHKLKNRSNNEFR